MFADGTACRLRVDDEGSSGDILFSPPHAAPFAVPVGALGRLKHSFDSGSAYPERAIANGNKMLLRIQGDTGRESLLCVDSAANERWRSEWPGEHGASGRTMVGTKDSFVIVSAAGLAALDTNTGDVLRETQIDFRSRWQSDSGWVSLVRAGTAIDVILGKHGSSAASQWMTCVGSGTPVFHALQEGFVPHVLHPKHPSVIGWDSAESLVAMSKDGESKVLAARCPDHSRARAPAFDAWRNLYCADRSVDADEAIVSYTPALERRWRTSIKQIDTAAPLPCSGLEHMQDLPWRPYHDYLSVVGTTLILGGGRTAAIDLASGKPLWRLDMISTGPPYVHVDGTLDFGYFRIR